MTRHQSDHNKSYPLYSNKHFQRNITMKISYCGHEKTWEVCGSFILLFLLTLALHSTLRPCQVRPSEISIFFARQETQPTYSGWQETKNAKVVALWSNRTSGFTFFLSTAKKKVLKCLRLDNLHSVERKKKYLEGVSQEIRSLNAKKVFFLLLLPLESSICSKWEYLILGNVQRDVWPPLYQEFKIDQFRNGVLTSFFQFRKLKFGVEPVDRVLLCFLWHISWLSKLVFKSGKIFSAEIKPLRNSFKNFKTDVERSRSTSFFKNKSGRPDKLSFHQ